MISDGQLAVRMWEQKTLFPDGWVFGNQYYAFSTPVLAALFYGLTGSINLAMALATLVMTLLILLAFWWMLKPFVGPEEIRTGILLLFAGAVVYNAPEAFESQLFFLMASYYAGYLITILVVLGDMLRAWGGQQRRFWGPSLVLGIALSFGAGIQSLRMTAVLVLPLVCMEALRWLVEAVRRRRLPGAQYRASAARIGLVALANLLGILLMRVLSIPQVAITGQAALRPLSDYGTAIWEFCSSIYRITGLHYIVRRHITGPFLGIYACLLVLLVLAGLLYAALRMLKGDATLVPALGFCLISLLAVLGAGMVLQLTNRSIYAFTWFLLLALAAIVIARGLRGRWRAVFSVALCVLALLNFNQSYKGSLVKAFNQEELLMEKIANWVEAEGYSLVYGGWSNVTQITLHTDGAVEAGSWMGEPYRILGYINGQDIYTQEDNRRAVYLFTGQKERVQGLRLARKQGVTLILKRSFDKRWLYESPVQLMHH